jgi:PadR family transcriptional regulator PadR
MMARSALARRTAEVLPYLKNKDGAWFKRQTQGRIELKEGSLYPVLYRLEDAGAIESVWMQPEGRGVPRKYYRCLPEGQSLLAQRRAEWYDYVGLITALIEGGSGHD